jgi:hypothetical protein
VRFRFMLDHRGTKKRNVVEQLGFQHRCRSCITRVLRIDFQWILGFSEGEVPVKKILIAGAAIAGVALCAGLVRLWLPGLARLAGRLSNSLSALRRAVPSQPPMPGNPVPSSSDSAGSRGALR